MERVRRAEELGGRGWEGGPVWQPEAIRWMVPDGPCFPSEPGTCAYTGQGVRQCLADYKLLISNDLQSGCRAVVCSMGDIGLFFPRGGRRAVCTPPHNAGTRSPTAEIVGDDVGQEVGGRQEDRTPDLRIANAALSQLR